MDGPGRPARSSGLLRLDGIHLYVSFGHAQMMPEAMPLLALDTWVQLLPFARGSLKGSASDRPARPRAVGLAGSRLYLDVTTPLRIPSLRQLMLGLFDTVYPQIAGAVSSQLARIGPDRRASLAGALPVLRLLAPVVPRVIAALAVFPVESFELRTNAAVTRIIDRIGSLDSARAVRDRLAVLFPAVPLIAPPIIAGIVAQKLLAGLGVGEAALQPVLRALPGNVTTEMDLTLADLNDLVRAQPALAAALRRDGFATVEAHPEAAAFLRGFREFLERYGMRGAGEIDLSQPRWRDDPGMLLSVVLGSIRGGEAGDHRRRHAALAAAAEAAIERLVSEVPWYRRFIVRRLLRVMRAGLGLREHPKYLLVQILARARVVAQMAGRSLAEAGILDRAGDVWFLTWDELVDGGAGPSTFRKAVESRRAAFVLDQKRQPPLVLASDGEIPAASVREDLPAGAIGGIGASAGVVEGPARVVLDPAVEVLHAGEILIAPFTDPGWTLLFTHAAGLATEVGGLMTHGSVIARELGIPAVVGAAGVTTRIHTGDRVRVDGSRGYVEVIAAVDTPPAAEPPGRAARLRASGPEDSMSPV